MKDSKKDQGMIGEVKKWHQGLPDKKKYLELITAFLSIPVLVTIILNNVGNIQNRNSNSSSTGEPKEVTKIITVPVEVDKSNNSVPTLPFTPTEAPTITLAVFPTGSQCKRQVGPVEIVYPSENDVVNKNPVCIDISYVSEDYCGVVWSYRINGGSWSDYTDKSICIYDMPPGTKELNLRVRSIVSTDEILLNRNFTVFGPTYTPVPTASSSAITN